MSWLFSQALVEEYSAENCLDGVPSAQLNVMPTPQAFLHNGKTMESLSPSPFGLTLQLLTEDHGEALLMWFLGVSPAPIFPQLERGQESTAKPLDSGWRWKESSVKYNPATVSWKIRQCSLLGDSDEFLGPWPRSGTMRNGECWERQALGHRIKETEFGLWATPAASDGTRGGKITENMTGQSLPQMVNTPAKWPTPKASDAGPDFAKLDRSGTGISLATAVAMYPTPTASNTKAVHMRGADKGKPRAPRSYMTPTAQIATKCGGRHNGKADTLASQIAELEELKVSSTGQLNPVWVEWLMGWPIGWTDSGPWVMDKCPVALRRHG